MDERICTWVLRGGQLKKSIKADDQSMIMKHLCDIFPKDHWRDTVDEGSFARDGQRKTFYERKLTKDPVQRIGFEGRFIGDLDQRVKEDRKNI